MLAVATLLVVVLALTLALGRSGHESDGASRKRPLRAIALETVSIEGVVREAPEAHVFVIGAEPVVVVHRGIPPMEGDRVVASGRIDSFDAPRLQEELGLVFEAELVRRFAGQRCLVATDVRTLPVEDESTVGG